MDEICNYLTSKKQLQQQNERNCTSVVITFVSLKVFTNESKELQSNLKKKTKFDATISNNINRRSLNNKAFIEVYFLNNKNDLKLFGKCEISNIIENTTKTTTSPSTAAAKECRLEIEMNENLQYFNVEAKNTLFFRLIFIKDVEIEFTNTFKIPTDAIIKTDQVTPVFCVNMYEMTNENANNKLFDLINENTNPTKMFHSLPVLKFKIDLAILVDSNSKLKTRKTNSFKSATHSTSSSMSSSLYLSPLSSPVTNDNKNKLKQVHRKSPLKSINTLNHSIDLYYQFIGRNNIKVLTKFEKHDLCVCPFCYFNCKCLDSLLKHLTCIHFRFQIEWNVS